ncbi:ABC transporter ATP-binding protein [Micromonospora sp. NBRC 101691]|uniref:ABC transporter ATP-binding protein n=1 Tax=Micromonospora sp. NBRC 101691 TaxID=3032198 RepID=UPI0024A28DFC|nr:ABC transporter ATP-binding protein [Micromonospora sp. NBRC 101691]GLY24654.1 cobalamin/Fe3+-siderophore ABC transporter ATP-binding protein [Micromonospora sp. NBRC 101691]
MTPALRLHDVSARMGGRTVLSGVDLDVADGSRLGIVGVNGAGKTTLLRVLAGVLHPSSGTALIADGRGGLVDLRRLPNRERARQLAYVPQEDVTTSELRVGEMVALGRVPQTRPWARGGRTERDVVLGALDAVGLAGRIDTVADQLSGGERRRAVLARGLAQQCPTVLLDEPTNHLDVAWQLDLLEVFATRARTLVATVHDLDLALRFFDRLALVGWRAGSDRTSEPACIVAVGPPAEVLGAHHVETQFGVGSVQVPHPDLPQHHLLIHPRKDTSPA